MYDLDILPKIVAGGKPLDGLSAVGTAVTGGASSIGRMLVETVEKTNHTPAGLTEFLHLRTTTTRNAYRRSRSWWGRSYNRMTGDHPVYVSISGHHLIQTLTLLGEKELSSKVPKNADCGIRVDIAEGYVTELLARYSRC